jgi:dnaD domain protein
MARPRKDGLDYFPLDVNFLSDLKIKKIIRAYGTQAVAVVMSVLTTIYRDNGYFATYDDDLIFIIADELKLEDGYVKNVIEKLIEVDFLSKEQKEKNNILTSIGIQERYLKACERRVKTTLNATYSLLNDSSTELPQTESTPEGSFCKQKPRSTGVNDSKSTQSKVNKNKVNKNKINNNLLTSSEKNSDVQELVNMYQENFGICNSLVINDLEKSLGYLDKDAIIESFRLSLEKDNPYLYMKGIWAKWKENGIKTYAQVKHNEEQHKQKRASYKPKGYVEPLPDWAI